MIGNGLAYAALVVRDVEAVASALTRHFSLARTDFPIGKTGRVAPVFGIGESALALFEPGDPFVGGQEHTGVHHIVLASEDPDGAAGLSESAGVPIAGVEPDQGLGGTRRIMLSPNATGGVRTYFSLPLPHDLDRSAKGWVEGIDHIGVACDDSATAIDAFSHRLGFPVESRQTDMEVQTVMESFTSDKYGVVYHSRPPEPVAGLRVVFITVGDCELELLQDVSPGQVGDVRHGQSGTTRQDQGAISRFIASRGPGLHHVALKVSDIDHALVDLERSGHVMIDTTGRPGSRRARIGFIHPRSLGGILMHLVQRDRLP
ncbi:MAG: VOC family protein [Dehalococcoidia bacterium]|nr:VOC family protein [Dehalococcoidia bacterium]